MTSTGPPSSLSARLRGKRRYSQRLSRLGARLVIVREPGHWSEWLVDQIAGNDEVPRRLRIPRSAAAGSSRFALILPCESLDDLSAGPAAEGIADGVTIDDRDERFGCG